MFVLLKGVSKEEAFRIGREISKAVTADNPKPVKLKFEKVQIHTPVHNTICNLFYLHCTYTCMYNVHVHVTAHLKL